MRFLLAGLGLPAIIAAQTPDRPVSIISVFDSAFHRVEDAEATAALAATTVTLTINDPPVQTTKATVLVAPERTTITSWRTVTVDDDATTWTTSATVAADDDATTMTTWATVTAEDDLTSIASSLPTKGLIPIPLGAQITSTRAGFTSTGFSTSTQSPSLLPSGVGVTTAPGATTTTMTTLLTRLGQTVTLPPQPMGFRPDWPEADKKWRLAADAPCKRGGKVDGNKSKCRLQRCMWEHTKPLNVTNSWPVVEFPITWTNATTASGNSSAAIGFGLRSGDYRTFWVQEFIALSGVPHWGTTKEGLYYPYRTLISSVMAPPTTILNKKATTIFPETGVTRTTIERVIPTPLIQEYEPAPRCSTLEECSNMCAAAEGKLAKHRRKMQLGLILGLTGGLVILGLLCCCLCCCRRRRRKNPQEPSGVTPRASSTMRTSTDPATGAQVVTYTSVGGQEQRGDTMGRQAEEGRSRVHFPEQGSDSTTTTAGQAVPSSGQTTEKVVEGPNTGPQKVVTVPAEGAQHVETIPAHDGADNWPAGSQRFDFGSIRGRKKMRADIRNLF